MLDTHDATRKSLIMTALGVFRVGIFVTLKIVRQLSLSDLHVTLHIQHRKRLRKRLRGYVLTRF